MSTRGPIRAHPIYDFLDCPGWGFRAAEPAELVTVAPRRRAPRKGRRLIGPNTGGRISESAAGTAGTTVIRTAAQNRRYNSHPWRPGLCWSLHGARRRGHGRLRARPVAFGSAAGEGGVDAARI